MSAAANTTAGQVEGVLANGLHVFKGIPFAAPPVGALRWQPPQPVEPWSGTRSAREFGTVSHQNPIALDVLAAMTVNEPQSEDCLYLNVWTPGTDAARRPVMVWIHGGAFVIGSGSQGIYDGESLAKRGDVVVVTINYRLGPLGFMNLADVTGGAIPATGTEGLQDQVAALGWVRDNIAAFGGDPSNVTIFGESAGGMSVGSLLAMPSAQGLFHKAIPQSGACQTAHTKQRATKVCERVLRELGTSNADELRAVTPERLLEVQAAMAVPGETDPDLGGMPFQPVVDGAALPELPIDAVRSGSARGVAVLVGTTLEEWKLFGAADPAVFALDDAGLMERLGANLSEAEARSIIDAYRKSRGARGDAVTPTELFMAIETDRIFRMPGLTLAETQRTHDPRVYSYLFTHKSPLLGGLLGACHALELGFVFGTNHVSTEFAGAGPAVDRLTDAMQESWLAFARTGDPSNDHTGAWSPYGEKRETMIFGEATGAQHAPYDEERRAWDGIAGRGRL